MKTIDGVPETLDHDQVLAAVRSLGFDPERLRALRIGTRYVEADVFTRQPPEIRADRNDVALHTVTYMLFDEP